MLEYRDKIFRSKKPKICSFSNSEWNEMYPSIHIPWSEITKNIGKNSPDLVRTPRYRVFCLTPPDGWDLNIWQVFFIPPQHLLHRVFLAIVSALQEVPKMLQNRNSFDIFTNYITSKDEWILLGPDRFQQNIIFQFCSRWMTFDERSSEESWKSCQQGKL